MTIDTEHDDRRRPPSPALVMLPGLGQSPRISHDLERSVLTTVRSRRDAGVLTDLDDALVALCLANAVKLDASVGIGRPSGRAKLIHAMIEALDALPAPTTDAGGLLPRFVAALTGRELDEDTTSPAFEPLPDLPPVPEEAGVQERGTRRTLAARRAAGLSVAGWAAHEALALMASADVDRALDVAGAPSGYAAVASAMSSILDRLPRPAGADADVVDNLLAAVEDVESPFTVLPPAAYHPDRDPSWKSEGAEIAAVARAMGRHLMPWQRHAADVATEYRLDELGRRRYRYHTVVIVVPRQSGKTDLTIPVQLHRALTREVPASVWYTAQSGQDARKRIIDLIERVEGSDLGALFKATRSNGAEGVRVAELAGAHVTRFSPTYKALHGEHPHLTTLDEFWHLDKPLGDALLGAIEPAQITLGSRAQLWLISTMGTHASEFMNGIVDDGRAGRDPGVCYIEYSLADGLDPFDPASWTTFHPALGNTIAAEDLEVRARRAVDDPARRATFLRAYCNRIVASDGTLIDLARWDDLTIPNLDPPALDEVTLAYEVAPGGSLSAVVAAWTDAETGRPAIRIVRQAPGSAWVAPYMRHLAAKWDAPIVADGAGPSGRITTSLVDAGLDVRTLSLPEFGQATEALLDYAGPEATLIHDGTDELRTQAAAATVRTSNGVRRFARDEHAPTPALIAAAIALYGHEHPEADPVGSIVL